MSRLKTVHGLLSFEKADSPVCVGCAHGKIHRSPFSINPDRKRAFRLGMFFHTDIYGPLQVASKGGHRYFITYKDDHSGYRFVFFLKDHKKILDTFKSMYKLAKRETCHAMVRLRSDNG